MKMTDITFWASVCFFLIVFQHYRQEKCQDKVFLSQPPLFSVYNQLAFGQWALEASWSSCRVPGPRWFGVRRQNFSSWKKTNRCVSCSPDVKWIYCLWILLLNIDEHILMTCWICVCLLSFVGMRRKLIAVLFSFSSFFFLLLVLKCFVLKDYLFVFENAQKC